MADTSLVQSLIEAYYHAKVPHKSHLDKLKASKHLDADGKVTPLGKKFLDRWFHRTNAEQSALLGEL